MELELKKALPNSTGYCSMKLELQRKSAQTRRLRLPDGALFAPKNNVELVKPFFPTGSGFS
jgi:hypothetical protein